jgi:hypothetical protein
MSHKKTLSEPDKVVVSDLIGKLFLSNKVLSGQLIHPGMVQCGFAKSRVPLEEQ